MGFLKFGTNASASIRDTVTVASAGTYKIRTRYSVSAGTSNAIDLYVNGTKVATPAFAKTDSDSDWAVDSQSVSLNAGANVVMFKANKAGSYDVTLDNIVVTPASGTTAIDAEATRGVAVSKDGVYDVYAPSGKRLGTVTRVGQQDLTPLVRKATGQPGIYFVRPVTAGEAPAQKIVVETR